MKKHKIGFLKGPGGHYEEKCQLPTPDKLHQGVKSLLIGNRNFSSNIMKKQKIGFLKGPAGMHVTRGKVSTARALGPQIWVKGSIVVAREI